MKLNPTYRQTKGALGLVSAFLMVTAGWSDGQSSTRSDVLNSGAFATLVPVNRLDQARAAVRGVMLKPGLKVSGTAGVEVMAPHLWREGNINGVSLKIRRVAVRDLPFPLTPGTRLGLPIYAIQASESVFTANRERFVVRLPLDHVLPATLAPLRLTVATVDADGDVSPRALWVTDDQAHSNGRFLEFEVPGFFSGEWLYFTAQSVAPSM